MFRQRALNITAGAGLNIVTENILIVIGQPGSSLATKGNAGIGYGSLAIKKIGIVRTGLELRPGVAHPIMIVSHCEDQII